jgi:hypothetical protein
MVPIDEIADARRHDEQHGQRADPVYFFHIISPYIKHTKKAEKFLPHF